MKTRSGLQAKKYKWLLDSINATTYAEDTGEIDITDTLTDKEKLEYIAERLRCEAFHEYNIQRFKGNQQNIITDHLMGLPSWLSIPFTNYDILKLLSGWGYDVSTEKKEDALLANYWNATAAIILQLFRRHGVTI